MEWHISSQVKQETNYWADKLKDIQMSVNFRKYRYYKLIKGVWKKMTEYYKDTPVRALSFESAKRGIKNE